MCLSLVPFSTVLLPLEMCPSTAHPFCDENVHEDLVSWPVSLDSSSLTHSCSDSTHGKWRRTLVITCTIQR
ncbi:hypothetical protein BJY52DRAFT_1329003 [Lactarius psammicola]|nr:hypothetical protein BJY52DRAFT_1329003 [Lactarius psammicola]